MENASKALIIAGGVLLAVIIMSLIAYFFAGVSEWPQQQDDTDYKEQLAKFNQEYEVYEKSAMYGTDVISCLNKVVNFDEKYVEEDTGFDNDTGEYKGGWLSGTKYGEKKEFAIDVSVTLNEDLEESLEVYYIDSGRESSTGNKEQLLYDKTESAKVEDAFKYLSNNPDTIKKERSTYGSYFMENQSTVSLVTQSSSSNPEIVAKVKKGTYNLLDDKTINTSGTLYELIKLSKFDLRVTIKNPESSTLRKWSTVIWKTPLYDFKSKRFRCEGIEYDVQTGRVNKISFSEI